MNTANSIHHYGVAVRDMNLSIEAYISRGYRISDKIYDEQQVADLVFLQKEGAVNIELVYSDIPSSPVYTLCSSYDERKYHTCYVVSSIESAIASLRKDGYIQVTPIKHAALFSNASVCFLYSKESGLIELLEKHDR